MGLDMYIRRISKPHLDATKTYRETELGEYRLILDEDATDDMFRDMKQYAELALVKCREIDLGKLSRDYGIDRPYLSSSNGNEFLFRSATDWDLTLTIPRGILMLYDVEVVKRMYAFKCEEVKYWRKAYDVQDWFYKELDNRIENTGYYLLDEEIQRKFNEEWPEHAIDVETPDEESALFYWEWY